MPFTVSLVQIAAGLALVVFGLAAAGLSALALLAAKGMVLALAVLPLVLLLEVLGLLSGLAAWLGRRP
jgi:hypothetical protein